MINSRAAGDARHARTGKDGALYNENGVLLASVESFQAQAAYSNAKYSVLGNAQELETANTFSVTLTMSQIVVEDDEFITELMDAMETQSMPVWNFQGTLKGRNGSEERVTYREVVPSGNIDIQNISTGDVIKRAWSFFVNRPPKLQSRLTIDN